MRLREIEREIKSLENEIEILIGPLRKQKQVLLDLREEAIPRKLITCRSSAYGQGCGKKSPIGTVTLIKTYWYVTPSGCTGGDYWNAGEKQFNCPKCGRRNRFLEDRDAKWKKYYDYFKDVVKEYDDN